MANDKALTKDSKFLSLVLRHKPQTIGIKIEDEGWVVVESLLEKCKAYGRTISMERLEEIVSKDEKTRYSFDADKKHIRANQGHSIGVDMKFEEKEPPPVLFHGTAEKNISSIKNQGLIKGNRQYVHLSKDRKTAIKVGQRHGKPVVLIVKAGEMYGDGYNFYLSENGVWLVDWVPTNYFTFEKKGPEYCI